MSSLMSPARIAAVALLVSLSAVASPGLSAQQLPPLEADAVARLDASPRHGEWVTVPVGGDDQVVSWVVYPERPDAAPVVVVIQEIFGMTDWIRSVADQLAAEGFIAIAPDLLTGKGPDGGNSDSVDQQGAVALVRELDPDEVNRRLRAAAEYAAALPAASGTVASIGFCWGVVPASPSPRPGRSWTRRSSTTEPRRPTRLSPRFARRSWVSTVETMHAWMRRSSRRAT